MSHPEGPNKVYLSPDWSAECHAFLEHWCAVRGDGLVPRSEKFLDCAPPQFMPNTYIVEIGSEGAIVRFQGTDLVQAWGKDFTNEELHSRRNEGLKERSLHNMRQVVAHKPCGYVVRITFSSSMGRRMHTEIMVLPLAVQPGRLPRLVCYSLKDPKREVEETLNFYLETHRADWIDIGAGVPRERPLDLLQA
jgi:hypothetical protein